MITSMPRIAIAVADFSAAVDTFTEQFGMPVLDYSPETADQLGARVAMCMPDGGSMVELMAPAVPGMPLSDALQKFLDRRGDGLYALMLEAPDPNAEAERIAERGMAVLPLMLGAGGRDIHPGSTHGVLIRVYPDGSVTRPGDLATRPPHVSGIMRVMIATSDATLAAKTWATGLGLDVNAPVHNPDNGTTSVTCTPPAGGVIEFVSVVDAGRPVGGEIAEHLANNGEGMFALVLHKPISPGGPSGSDDRSVTKHSLFGTRIWLETDI